MVEGRKLSMIEALMEKIAPTWWYDEDPSGIQIDCGRKRVRRVLVCLEINDDVISEAKQKKADMIVTHHPLLFQPLKSISPDTPAGRYVIALIKAGIGVYSSHLPFDASVMGNNMYPAGLLKLQNVMEQEDGEIGSIGYLPKAMNFKQLCTHVERSLDLPKHYIRCVDGGRDKLEKIAFCTGAGGDFIYRAVELRCDAYITGDLKLHEAQYAKAMGLTVIDAGHYGTEKIFTENMAAQLRKAAEEEGIRLEVMEAEANTNPYTL